MFPEKDELRAELLQDLRWIRFYARWMRVAMDNYDPEVLLKPYEWYEGRWMGCYDIIARIVSLLMEAKNEVHGRV